MNCRGNASYGFGRCAFDGVLPSLARVLLLAKEEMHLWGLAGAEVFLSE
jgi:hypothetical protein